MLLFLPWIFHGHGAKKSIVFFYPWFFLCDSPNDSRPSTSTHECQPCVANTYAPSLSGEDPAKQRCTELSTKELTLWRPAAFGDFRKKRLNACGFARQYLRSCTGYGPGRSVRRHGMSSSLHLKKIFCLGAAGFLWVTS